MEGVASSRPSYGNRIAAGIILLVGALAFALGYAQELLSFKVVLFAVFGVVGINILLLPYKWAIRILFLYLGFEGLLKMLTQYNPVVHVGSDLLVVALTGRLFFSFLLMRFGMPKEKPPLLWLFGLHFAWYLIEFLNPYSLGVVASLAGAKVYVTMTLLFGYGFYLAESVGEMHWYMAIWIFHCVIQIVTGLYQSAIGPASVTWLSPQYAVVLSRFDGFAFRPFGTTHLAGGPSEYVCLASVFIVYFIVTQRSILTKLFLTGLIPLGTMLLMICQVRVMVMKSMFGMGAFVLSLLITSKGRMRGRLIFAVSVAAAALALALPKLTERWVEERSENAVAISRTETLFNLDLASKARAGALERIIAFSEIVPLGAGLSRSGAAIEKFRAEADAQPWFKHGFFGDNFWAATIAEIGIPGSLILTAIVFSILIRGWTSLLRLRDQNLIALQAAILCSVAMLVTGFWGGESILYNPEGPFFWFFSGALMRLPRLDTSGVPRQI